MPIQDQAAAPAGQSKEPLSLQEQIDKGWEQVELLTAQEAEAANPKKPEADEAPKAPGDSTSKPFTVIKVGGKEVPVASEAELIALAQKGYDYTKKTQALADDRRSAEAELKSQTASLAEHASRMEALLEKLVSAGVLPAQVQPKPGEPTGQQSVTDPGDKADDEVEILKAFDIDPAQAYPHEKKMARKLSELERSMVEIRLQRASEIVDRAVVEERENFPVEPIVDDQGKDVTQARLAAIVAAKRQAAGANSPALPQVVQWAREAVRELHDSQRSKPQAAEQISDDMDPEEFAKRFPKLAQSVKGRAEEGAIPPPLKPGSRPVGPGQRKAFHPSGKSLDEIMDAGFNDPDIIKALRIGG